MRKLEIVLLLVVMLVSVCGVFDAYAKSSKNKAACEAWCNKNKPKCEFCWSRVGCKGRTYDIIKKFKDGTGHWYACGLSKWGLNSKENQRQCDEWCDKNEKCTYCMPKMAILVPACGKGEKVLKRFSGSGENWHACQKTNWAKESEANEQRCKEWCEKSEECEGCTKHVCGKGIKLLRRFSGGGKNWYACQKTNWAKNTEKSKAEAEKWCEWYKKNSGKDCRIVKSGKSCPDGFYKSVRPSVSWGRDYKVCTTLH